MAINGFDRRSMSLWLLTLAALLATCFGATLHSRTNLRSSQALLARAQIATNHTHPAFKVVKSELVAEYDMKFTLYKHIATGAELMSVESEETNKVFGITFRTPASDSTGVPHIMEHSVLCGSKKYPVKDPFIQLRRTSLQTYLNAFTYPDRTVYPVASQNLKDFYNLANVYLDAVLHPRAIEDPMVLAQEGWHLELEKEDKPLQVRGIVYNEMKGGYSAPDERLHREAMRKLFPDTTYRFDSGGDPKEIPDLSFDRFKKFYDQYYHPSNARVFFFGNDPVDARLELLDSYLAEFGKPPAPVEVTRIETQKKWKAPKRVESPYPVTAEQAAAEGGAKHTVTLYWLLNEEPMAYAEQLGMSMVTHLLLGSSQAPLHKALIKSGYGASVTGGGYSDDLKQATFSVGLKGIQKDDVPKVEALIMETLSKIVKDGFAQDAVKATVNSVEFSVREFSTASSNRGLSFYLTALSSWIYEQDPIHGLKFEAPLAEVKANIADKKLQWLESFVKKYLINNDHRLTLEGVPDATMGAKEEAAEKKKLSDLKASMSKEKLADVMKSTADLKAVQKQADTPEQLATLPKLSIGDIERKEKDFDITVGEKQGVTVLSHKVSSSGLIYADMVFDLAVIPVDYLPVLPLFMSLLFDVGTSKLDAAAFTHLIGAKTGGIGVSKMNALKLGKDGKVGDSNDIAFRLVVYGKSTASQADDLFDLMLTGIADSKLDSQARALEILKSTKSGMESSLRSAGSSYAQTRILARRSLAGYLDEITSGISYYESLPGLLTMAEKDWPKLLSQLEAIQALLFDEKAVLINLSADKKSLDEIDSSVDKLVQSLLTMSKKTKRPDVKGPFVADAIKGKPLLRLAEKDEGFEVPTQVNYVVKGGALYNEGDAIPGSTDVVVRLISQSYMWDTVRVLGGAYGGGCSLSHHSGTFLCYSYRDPNLKETLAVFDKVAAHLEGLKLDDQAVEQLIIGAVGDLDKPMSPSSQGYASMTRWLLNDKLEFRQKLRDEMFATTAASFADFGKKMRASTDHWRSSIFGSKTAFTKANDALPEDKKIPLVMLH
jgi:Zn-dependent M16 (insulinase) family peptidase